jgi:hypothetical protein
MSSIYLLDVPENETILDVARVLPGVEVTCAGPYFAVTSPAPITIDRRSTGVRHAVWYSWVAGLDGWRIARWDKDGLEVVAR